MPRRGVHPHPFSSAGVLLFQVAGGVNVARNRSARNDDNFASYEATGVTLTSNRATDSIFFDATTATNHIRRNVAFGNEEHDCHDDSVGPVTGGTANSWRANRGQTENRPGLCRGSDDDGEGQDEQGEKDDD